MNVSKHFISGLAASAVVVTVGLAYAQTTETTPPSQGSTAAQPSTTEPSHPAMTQNAPAATSDSTNNTAGSDSSSSSTTSTEPAPQADRN